MKFEYYQDKDGNAYELKTDLEQLLVHDMSEQGEEIERLNNIINELRKYIGNEYYCFDNESLEFKIAKDILNKIQELKEMVKSEI
jgi:hypothetical protein